jgi:hypothetical protein
LPSEEEEEEEVKKNGGWLGGHQKRTFQHLLGIIFLVWRLGMMGTVDFALCF